MVVLPCSFHYMIVHGKCDNGFASSNLTVMDIIFKNLYILCDIHNFLHMKVHIYCILSGSITDTLVISDPFIDTTFRNSVHMPFPNYLLGWNQAFVVGVLFTTGLKVMKVERIIVLP